MILAPQQCQSILVSLTKRVDGLLHSMQLKRSILHPIRRMPTELLELTFLSKPSGKGRVGLPFGSRIDDL